MGRPDWRYEHWPTCTCAECQWRRQQSHGYYQERRTSHTILTVVVVLFILGMVVALAFVGVEPLAPFKNALTGSSATPAGGQPPGSPGITVDKQVPGSPVTGQPSANPPVVETRQEPPAPQVSPQPPQQQSSPGVPLSEKPSPLNIADLEKQIHSLVNVERTRNGLAVVGWDDALSAVARGHSEDMAKRNYFNHVSPDGQNSVDRCKLAGINISKNPVGGMYYLGCSENIFQCSLVKVSWYTSGGVLTRAEYYSLAEIADLAVKGWMGSPGHRENILKSYWHTEGIGIAISASGDVNVTENFN